MKRALLTPVILILLAAACVPRTIEKQTSSGGGGDNVGNGGDGVVLDFQAHAKAAIEDAKAHEVYHSEDLKRVEDSLDSISIESTDAPLFDRKGTEKDAINIPEKKKIVVSRTRFPNNNSNVKKALALHEYFLVNGIADDNYQLSTRMLRLDPRNFAALKRKVDIVVVIGGIGRGFSQGENIANQLRLLISSLKATDTDFHLGFVPAVNFSKRIEDGGISYFNSPCEIAYVTRETVDTDAYIRSALAASPELIETASVFDTVANGFQYNASIYDQGFYRQDANLEIILISEIDDKSPIWTADTFVRSMKNLKNNTARVTISAFTPITDGQTTCGIASPYDTPYVIQRAVALSGGLLANSCPSIISKITSDIFEMIETRLLQ